MYERVLRFFELSKKEQKEIPPEYWICRETAYNLSLIYKQRYAPSPCALEWGLMALTVNACGCFVLNDVTAARTTWHGT
jgi:hypothetical protein